MNANVEHGAGATACPEPKERIFHAAMSVALRNGFGKVTLNGVAREAGFSKGGLLYHFTTKNELIRAMLAYYSDPASRRAAPFAPGEQSSCVDPFAVAVLIAAAENPALIEPFREMLQSPERKPSEQPGAQNSLLGCLANSLGSVGPVHGRGELNTAA